MATVNQRLFNNAYFRSIDALLLLASFRFATLIEWLLGRWRSRLPCCWTAPSSGRSRPRSPRQHDPELFALYTCGAIIMVCATVIGFVVPFTRTRWQCPVCRGGQPAAEPRAGEFSSEGERDSWSARRQPGCTSLQGRGAASHASLAARCRQHCPHRRQQCRVPSPLMRRYRTQKAIVLANRRTTSTTEAGAR